MEQARKTGPGQTEAAAARPRTRFDDAAQFSRLEKAMHVVFPTREGAPGPAEGVGRRTSRDFSNAIELVRDAAEFMRNTEERARDSEFRMHELVQRATDELKAAELRIQVADARARAADARADEAEQRLRDAEEWLGRIFDVIAEELPTRPAAG